MPVRQLPPQPSLAHLKHQAKDLLTQHRAPISDPALAQRLREFHLRLHNLSDAQIFATQLTLADAQLTIAREHGFPSWPRLKRHIEAPTQVDRLDLPHHDRIEDPLFRHAVHLIDTGSTSALAAHLKQHPTLIHQRLLFEGRNYFHTPTLLEFIAENPIRHGKLPANILEITKTLLAANPDQASRNETLMLVATGSVTRECGHQIPLIDLLCDQGADPNTAIRRAAALHEPASAEALLRRGAHLDLPIAAALGRRDHLIRLLPSASPADLHLALALASGNGHIEIVRILLESGVNPNRYNPIGGHSHATPLHQVAGAGNRPLADLLLRHGARLDLKDVLWHATPAEWAAHENHTALAQHLRDQEKNVLPDGPAAHGAVTS